VAVDLQLRWTANDISKLKNAVVNAKLF